MKRIEIEGSSPHFIGSWQIEQESICDALIEFFENHQEKHEPGASAGGVNVETKNDTDVTIHPRDLKKPECGQLHRCRRNWFGAYLDNVPRARPSAF